MTGEVGGILCVDKPEGPTSHDIVARARRALGTRRVGHAGTLDPFASGLLLLCVGQATRLSEFLVGLPKSYEAEAFVGVRTTTDDREGEPLETRGGAEELSTDHLDGILAGFLGRQLQTPPPFSAKKIGGEAAHRKARRGERVELEPVEVEIRHIARTFWVPPRLGFEVDCSSGTYIRALARDLGEQLGTGAHLTSLRRTRVGPHRVEGAVSGDHLDDAHAVAAAWLPLRTALGHLPCAELQPDDLGRLRMGQPVSAEGDEQAPEDVPVALFLGERLVAMAERRGQWFHPRKVLSTDA